MGRALAFLFWAVVIVVGVPVFGIIVYMAVSSFTGSTKTSSSFNATEVTKLAPSNLLPSGDLARTFGFFTEYTDLQREKTARELTGVVVEWRLPVYDVSAGSPFFRIQTASSNNLVGTFCYVLAQNDGDRNFLSSLKTGDFITCKGVINGVSLRHIEIKPAVIMR